MPKNAQTTMHIKSNFKIVKRDTGISAKDLKLLQKTRAKEVKGIACSPAYVELCEKMVNTVAASQRIDITPIQIEMATQDAMQSSMEPLYWAADHAKKQKNAGIKGTIGAIVGAGISIIIGTVDKCRFANMAIILAPLYVLCGGFVGSQGMKHNKEMKETYRIQAAYNIKAATIDATLNEGRKQ